MKTDYIDLTDFKELLTAQEESDIDPLKKEGSTASNLVSPPQALIKVARKYRQRERERQQNSSDFPDDYFFSALVEFVLDD